MANKVLNRIKGILKIAAISVPVFSPFLGAGTALGGLIGTFVTKAQLTDYVHSQPVTEFVETLQEQTEDRFNNGELSEEEYKVALSDIKSKEDTLEYANIVYANDEEYLETVKNYENCGLAGQVGFLTAVGGTLVSFALCGSDVFTGVLQSADVDFANAREADDKEM